MVLHWMPDSGVFGQAGGRWGGRRGKPRLTETLLAEGDALQLVEAVALGGAVDDGVLEQHAVDAVVVDGGLDADAAVLLGR